MVYEDKLVISVEQAGRLLGCGRSLAYKLARKGQLPTLRLGRKLVVPIPALQKLLENPTDFGGRK